MPPGPASGAGFRACPKTPFCAHCCVGHLTRGSGRTILAAMKIIPAVLFLALACIRPTLGQDQVQNLDATNLPPREHEMTVPLFNGRDFSGWAFCMKGNADPKKTW